MYNRSFYLLLIVAGLCLGACSSKKVKTEPALYYWKNDAYYLTSGEVQYLQQLNVQKLYVKLFEVEYNALVGNVPVAKSNLVMNDVFSNTGDNNQQGEIDVVPVVFIKNEVLIRSSKVELDSLAGNIVFLTLKYYNKRIGIQESVRRNGYKELQIDCDWTAKSRDNYFYLLRQLKKLSGATLSCTLRLYPYKYPQKMGVPPVDKAMLMCYNLVGPLENEDKNSILDNKELKSYLNTSGSYPLHLDFALPVYSWMMVYRNERFSGILGGDNHLLETFRPLKPLWYEAQKDTVVEDFYLRAGDKIKYEEVSATHLREAVKLLKENTSLDDSITVALFQLDEKTLKKYSHETLRSLYSDFGR